MHITAWRNFALQKLIGNVDFKIKLNSPQDWALIRESSLEAWQEVLQNLEQNQNELLKALENISDEKLSENVPNKSYKYYK